MDMDKCIYCGSEKLIRNVKIGLSVEVGVVWPKYNKFLTGTEQMLADICEQCRSITRFHIDDVNKNWITK